MFFDEVEGLYNTGARVDFIGDRIIDRDSMVNHTVNAKVTEQERKKEHVMHLWSIYSYFKLFLKTHRK